MTDSSIIRHKDGSVTFAGSDAISIFQAATLSSAIGMLQVKVIPGRGWTMPKALARASKFTGIKYKRSQAAQARADLKIWIELMKSTIPTEEES